MSIQGYYKFNGNSNDYSGNNRNGTATGVSYINRGINLAAETNGTTGKIMFGGIFNFTTEDFTFSLLFNLYSFATVTPVSESPILFSYGQGWGQSGYYVPIDSAGISFITCDTINKAILTSCFFNFEINKYYLLTITRSGTSIRIYIDGIDKTTTAGSHSTLVTTTNPTYNTFRIGRYIDDTLYGYFSHTLYEEFKVSNDKWNPANVKNEYARIKGFF